VDSGVHRLSGAEDCPQRNHAHAYADLRPDRMPAQISGAAGERTFLRSGLLGSRRVGCRRSRNQSALAVVHAARHRASLNKRLAKCRHIDWARIFDVVLATDNSLRRLKQIQSNKIPTDQIARRMVDLKLRPDHYGVEECISRLVETVVPDVVNHLSLQRRQLC
jgi:hypothetical protein